MMLSLSIEYVYNIIVIEYFKMRLYCKHLLINYLDKKITFKKTLDLQMMRSMFVVSIEEKTPFSNF